MLRALSQETIGRVKTQAVSGRVFEPLDDAVILQNPHLWPEYPFVRVDRRVDPRQGQGTCFVRADEEGQVEPVVYVTSSWPPPEDVEPMVVVSFAFQDFRSLVKQGWKVVALIT